MTPGTKRPWLERRPKNRLLFEHHGFDHLCHGVTTTDREVKFHDHQLVVNFRSDFINQPQLKRHVPPPGDLASELDIQLEYKKRQLGRHREDFHEVTNLVVKKILKELYFENDTLKMFLHLSKKRSLKKCPKPEPIEVDSSPFKKILLILEAMKIHQSKKLVTDAFSKRMSKFLVKKIMDIRQNKGKYKEITKMSTVIKIKKQMFQLFDEFEEKKLALEKGWSIHENVITGRINWAVQYLTATVHSFQILSDASGVFNPNKFYWHLAKMARHLRSQELLVSKIEYQNDRKKLKDWKLVIDRLVGFRENIKGSPMEHYQRLHNFLSVTENRRKTLALEFEGLLNYIDLFRMKAGALEKKEKDLNEHHEGISQVLKHLSKNKHIKCVLK